MAKGKRGLASASKATREAVARKGGKAPHVTRGRQASQQQDQSIIM